MMNTTTPTAVLADDEPHLAQALQQQLHTLWPALRIAAVARNGIDAARAIAQHAPDVAFLDIQMPGLTGLEVAQGIEGPTRVVFVTAFDEYAVQAFEQSALDYLLKPVKAERLARTADKLKAALAAAAQPAGDDALAAALQRLLPGAPRSAPPLRWIRASVGELTQQIDVRDVLFFEADEKYTVVHTSGGAEHLIRTPIVNVAHLAGARRDETSRLFLRVKGVARELPVSRAYVHLFKAM